MIRIVTDKRRQDKIKNQEKQPRKNKHQAVQNANTSSVLQHDSPFAGLLAQAENSKTQLQTQNAQSSATDLKTQLPADELDLFRTSVKGAKQIKHDTHFFSRSSTDKQINRVNNVDVQSQDANKIASSFQFSDIYQPNLPSEGAMRYLREDVDNFELKRLKRGDYIPELFLDLHGLTQQQAKRELAALLEACVKENVQCACVMHGYGKNILSQQVPFWLAQHPAVLAFHQATKEWGGDAALLVLMEVEEDQLLRR